MQYDSFSPFLAGITFVMQKLHVIFRVRAEHFTDDGQKPRMLTPVLKPTNNLLYMIISKHGHGGCAD